MNPPQVSKNALSFKFKTLSEMHCRKIQMIFIQKLLEVKL